jgi:hypothetical protein
MAVVFNGTGDATVILDYDNYRVGNCSARSIGNNAYLNIKIPGEDIKLANDFTIEGWFYFDAIWATYEMIAFKKFIEINGDPSTIVESYDGINNSSDDPDFYVGYSNDQGSLFTPNPTLTVGFKEIDSEQHHQLFYYWELPTEQWIHFAIVRNNNQIRLYIDGNEVTTAQYSGNSSLSYIPVDEGIEYSPSSLYDQYPNAAPYAFDTNVKIGLDYHGNFDEFRIRNGAVYTSNFTPSTTPFEPSLISDILLLHFDGNFSDDIYNVRGDSEISAQFTATTLAGVIQSATIAVDSAFSQSTQGLLVIPTTINLTASTECTMSGLLTMDAELAIDTTFAQTTNAGKIITLVNPFEWVTHPTWDEWLIWQNTFNLPATFTQTTQGDTVELHLAEMSVSAEFVTDTDSTVLRPGVINITSNFENYVALSGLVFADIDMSGVFDLSTDTQVLHLAELDLTSASEFSATIIGTRIGDIDINATTTLAIDSTVNRPGVIEASAEFAIESNLVLVINGELHTYAAFTNEIDSLVNYGSTIQLNTAFNTVIDSIRIVGGALDISAETEQSTAADLNAGANILISAEFNLAEFTPVMNLSGSAKWTALTATGIFGTSDRPDPCRTLTILAETRTLTVGVETRILNLKACSLRRAA